METQAIKEARRFLRRSAEGMGLMPTFQKRSAQEIDQVIEACVDGFQESMRKQVAAKDGCNDEIPF
jgi:hypothetical protein